VYESHPFPKPPDSPELTSPNADSASDAYAAVQLYHIMDHQRCSLDPSPPLPSFAELGLPIKLADGVTTIPAAEGEGDSPARQAAAEKRRTLKQIRDSITIQPVSDDPVLLASDEPALPAPPPPPRPKDPRVTEADAWAAQYRQANPTTRAPVAALRAYHLWHRLALTPDEIAELLRDPPLLRTTVTGYIVDSIRWGPFEYDRRRMKTEILDHQPLSMLVFPRYKPLVRACADLESEDGEEE